MEELTPLRKLQLTELGLAKKYTDFCDSHNLRYFMIGGTFLGAVRHKGFVPWDDDMDFGMYREDYERFLQLCKTETLPFEVHNFFLDETSSRGRYHIRLENPAIKVRRSIGKTAEETNVWIDICPFDGMPNHSVTRTIWSYWLLWRRTTYKFSVFNTLVDIDSPNRPFVEKMLIAAGKVFPVEKIFQFAKEIRRYDKALKKHPPSKSKYVFQAISPYRLKELYKKEILGEGKKYEMEGFWWRGPQDKDSYLTQLYGDYMTLPPVKQRDWHKREEILFDEGLSEMQYEIPNKEIITRGGVIGTINCFPIIARRARCAA